MKWQYTVWRTPNIDTSIEEAMTEINALGAQGWELIAQQGGGIFWFKRPYLLEQDETLGQRR